MPSTANISAIHSLDHIEIGVPDLDEASRFYAAFGLRTERVGDCLDLYCFDHPHRWARLAKAPAKVLQRIVFGAYPDDIDPILARLERAGIASLEAGRGHIDLIDPDGNPVSIIAAEKSSPSAKACPSSFHSSVEPGRYAAPFRSKAPLVRPRRLAHALFFTADVARAIDFYTGALGLSLSDEAGEVAFLHGRHGSDHHLIAFAAAPGRGLHHLSWDVGSVQEVGLGMSQMIASGYPHGWGVGRHVLGSNYFYYARDPWGSYSEYSFDIDYIPADTAWKSGHVAPEDGFYLWGPEPPEDFAVNYELASGDVNLR